MEIVRNLEELTDAFMDPTEGSKIVVADFPIVLYFDSDKHYLFWLRTVCADAGNMVFNLLSKEKREPCSSYRMSHCSIDLEISLGKNVKLFESYKEQEQIDKNRVFSFLVPHVYAVEEIRDYRYICFDKEKRKLKMPASDHNPYITFYEKNSKEFQDILKAELELRKEELEFKKERVQNYQSIISNLNF